VDIDPTHMPLIVHLYTVCTLEEGLDSGNAADHVLHQCPKCKEHFDRAIDDAKRLGAPVNM